MFITSKGTMDKASPPRWEIYCPERRAFRCGKASRQYVSGKRRHGVTSDILILQKRDSIIDIEPEWVHLDTDANGITMNSYFVSHPEMVLGEMKMESTRFGMDSACKAYPDVPLAGLLHEAMQRINGEIPEQDMGIDANLP